MSLISYDEWKMSTPDTSTAIEDLQYKKCDLCGDIISVEDLLVLKPIINRHYPITICDHCLTATP